MLKFEVDAIEDVAIYSATEGTPTVEARLSTANAKLEREKRDLAFQLRQAIRENKDLQNEMVEVEILMVRARELKEENEGLIDDYQNFKTVQEGEMDELIKMLKETMEENDQLQKDNQRFVTQLNKLETKTIVETTAPELDEIKQENARLLIERDQLKEAVNRQSQTILEMDEKLRERNEHAVGFEKLRKSLNAEEDKKVDERADSSKDSSSESGNYKEMYEELRATSMLMLHEVENKEELLVEYNRVTEEYEELRKQTAVLRATLDEKYSEIKRLTIKVEDLTDQLDDSLVDFRNAVQKIRNEHDLEMRNLLSENRDLKSSVEELKRALDDKERMVRQKIDDVTVQALASSADKSRSVSASVSKEIQTDDLSEQYCFKVIPSSELMEVPRPEFKDMDVEINRMESPVFQDLQNAMIEAKKLLKENRKLKQIVSNLKTEGQSPETTKMEAENRKLQEHNYDLELEISGLKRTIGEQGAYLARVGKDEKLFARVVFPSEPEDPKFLEGKESSDSSGPIDSGNCSNLGRDESDLFDKSPKEEVFSYHGTAEEPPCLSSQGCKPITKAGSPDASHKDGKKVTKASEKRSSKRNR